MTSLALTEDFLVGGGATGCLCQWCLYLTSERVIVEVDLENEGVVVSNDCLIFLPYVCCMRWVGYVARVGERRSAYRVLMGKPGGRKHFGRPRRT